MERAGLIQLFEVTFELAWKVFKDYLEAEGYIMKSPRQTIKQAFQMGIIEDGHTWIDALSDRNLTGLIDRDFFYIRKALEKYSEIARAILYGSRALGNNKSGSDVDLAIVGERVSHRTMVKLNDDLNEEYPLPYMFDLLHYDEL
ncbi:HI0074 family nucleotidyltransferase substrate-binding subunit [Salicibibacter cibi]|uniref:HI0074 family nucleotidyltransferase substrate-binding subunit n=1 Tax=Salicibibacter cibi TaxID=2743001 RepID=UPI00190448D6|nr:HI0074 family nucleotidyltransferase substrate-binding subunit [Salicibibacter cibi]